jgi:hypothetical protein
MVRVLLLTSVVTGVASQYDPGVFESVVRVRQAYGSLPDDLPDYDGAYVAVLDCDAVGDQVLVCKGADCRFALVADCAGIADGGYAWMVRNRVAGELDYDTALRLRAVGQEIVIHGDASLAGVVPGRGLDGAAMR